MNGMDGHDVDKAIDEAAREMTAGEPGSAFTTRVMARVQRRPPAWNWRWAMAPVSVAAASAVIVVALRTRPADIRPAATDQNPSRSTALSPPGGAPSASAGALSASAGALSASAGALSASAGALSASAGALSASAGALSASGGAPSASAGALSASAGAPRRQPEPIGVRWSTISVSWSIIAVSRRPSRQRSTLAVEFCVRRRHARAAAARPAVDDAAGTRRGCTTRCSGHSAARADDRRITRST